MAGAFIADLLFAKWYGDCPFRNGATVYCRSEFFFAAQQLCNGGPANRKRG
jgi:hypothetical protein